MAKLKISDEDGNVKCIDKQLRIYSPNIVPETSASFGSPLIGRTYQAESLGGYRYSFNGKEKDDETYGDGNEMDFGARIYDGRLGRWMSLDPMQMKFPGESHYSYAGNSPIIYIDKGGKYKVIYIAFLPDALAKLSPEQQKEIIQKAQQVLRDNNIDITVVGINVTERVDVSLLNQSDNIVYLGQQSELEREFQDDINVVKGGTPSHHVTKQESWVDIDLYDDKAIRRITKFDDDERKADDAIMKKTGEDIDREGYMGIAVIHEAFHRWFEHATAADHCEKQAGVNYGCNEGTASVENVMSCGHSAIDYGGNYPMQQGTLRFLLKQSAKIIQNIYGSVSNAGWDKNKTRDNLTLKKEANVKKNKNN